MGAVSTQFTYEPLEPEVSLEVLVVSPRRAALGAFLLRQLVDARGAEAGKKSEVIQKSTLNREHRIKSVHALNTWRVHYHETRLYSRWHTNAIVVDHLWPVGHCKICTAGRKYSKHTVHSIKPSSCWVVDFARQIKFYAVSFFFGGTTDQTGFVACTSHAR